MLRQLGRFRLKMNTNYTISFKVKGKFGDGLAFIGWTGFKKLSEGSVSLRVNGAAEVRRNEVEENNFEVIRFSSGAGWTEVKKDFKVTLKGKGIADLKGSHHLAVADQLQPAGWWRGVFR